MKTFTAKYSLLKNVSKHLSSEILRSPISSEERYKAVWFIYQLSINKLRASYWICLQNQSSILWSLFDSQTFIQIWYTPIFSPLTIVELIVGLRLLPHILWDKSYFKRPQSFHVLRWIGLPWICMQLREYEDNHSAKSQINLISHY